MRTTTLLYVPSILTCLSGLLTGQSGGPPLVASNASSSRTFGWSLELDGTRAIVGSNGFGTGSAYVFEYDPSTGWTEDAELSPSDGQFNDNFGFSVSISGDTAAVGSLFAANPPGVSEGAIYVYDRTAPGSWSETVKLTVSNPQITDFGDVLDSEDSRIAVGSDGVTLFDRDAGGTWSFSTTLASPENPVGALGGNGFGSAFELSGDRVLVGAFNAAGAASQSGEAYLFELVGGAWIVTDTLRASDGLSQDEFARAVAIDGDRAVIGAPGHSSAGSDSGAAYVFERSTGGAWVEVQKLVAGTLEAGDRFGGLVDLDGDRLIVGASGDDDELPDFGAVYVFERDVAGTWIEAGKLTANDGLATTDDYFAQDPFAGRSLGVSGEWVLVGAARDDTAANAAGAVYPFDFSLINSDATSISLTTGGQQVLRINADVVQGGKGYFVLGSITGTSPGISFSGLTVPLNPDEYFLFTLSNPNSPGIGNSLGLLDPVGNATAVATVPAGLSASLAGTTVHHAVVGLDLTPFVTPDFVSGTVQVQLTL